MSMIRLQVISSVSGIDDLIPLAPQIRDNCLGRDDMQNNLIVQKRAIRALTGLEPQHTCREAFSELKILTVIALYILESVLLFVKSGQKRNGELHSYNTRNGHNFARATHHLSFYEKMLSYRQQASYLLVIRGTDVIWASNLELLELIFFLKEQAARSAAQRAGIYRRRSRTMLARCAALRAACSFRKKINSSSSKFEAQITSVPLITNSNHLVSSLFMASLLLCDLMSSGRTLKSLDPMYDGFYENDRYT
ncbi:hypothetical protein J6590_071639 [Homalodisca vitripennis]|nr:hypothetical protein J6590_071639 [Homalodisca vitripennis]